MRVNEPVDRILQSRRSSFVYLEYCRVHLDGDRLIYAVSADAVTREWNIPVANTSVILLGSGSSITQAAARKLAGEKVLVAFTGNGGTPIFLGSLSEYAPTDNLIRWIKFWPDEKARLEVAKYLAYARCDAIEKTWPNFASRPDANLVTYSFKARSQEASTVEQLRGFEGDFAKSVYKEGARATSVAWDGRQAGQKDQDLVNGFLDQGNYLAYGLAGVVLWALGIPAGLAVNHGATRAGGLVFDLADTIKDAIVLPVAFEAAAQGLRSQEFRENVIESFDAFDTLPNLFDIMKEAISIGSRAA